MDTGRPKGLRKGKEWTKGDVHGGEPGSGPEADLSTDWHVLVDLSPGREANLWITPVDNENLQVRPR